MGERHWDKVRDLSNNIPPLNYCCNHSIYVAGPVEFFANGDPKNVVNGKLANCNGIECQGSAHRLHG